MAEGFLKTFMHDAVIVSAGTNPEKEVNPYAIKVMSECNIDISKNKPKNVSDFLNKDFDYLITVCDKAKETCPVFNGKVNKRIHIGFEDPAYFKGTEEEILNKHREIRNEIYLKLKDFYNKIIKS